MTSSTERRVTKLETGNVNSVDIAAVIEETRQRVRTMTPAELRTRQVTRLDTLLAMARDRRLSRMERLIVEGTQRALALEAAA